MQRRKVSKKKKRFNLPRLIMAAVIGLALLAGLVFTVIQLISGASPSSNLTALPFGPADNYFYTGSGFLYYSSGRVYYQDLADDKKNFSVGSENAAIQMSGGSNITVVYHSTAMHIMGVSSPIEFTGTVLKVVCGNSHVAVLHQDSQGALSLLIYDSQGNQKDELAFADQELIDFGFYGSCSDALWTLDMDVSGEIPTSTIKTYNIDNVSITGVLSVQNQAVDQVLMTDKSIFVVGTNHLIRYSANSEAYRLLIYGYRLIDNSRSQKPAFLFVPSGETSLSVARLYVLNEEDVANESVYDLSLPEETIAAFLSGTNPVAVTPNAIHIYQSSGKLNRTIELSEQVSRAVKLNDAQIMVETATGFHLVHIG